MRPPKMAEQADAVLSIWTVYDHPTDFPNEFVARRWEVHDKPVPTDDIITSNDVNLIRASLASRGLTCLAPSKDDDPNIVETWL